MKLNGFWEVFLIGCLGGLFVESVKWYKLRYTKKLPSYVKSFRYWFVTIVLVIIGGILTALYGISNVNAFLALNIGASAPLIISSLARIIPNEVSTQRSIGGKKLSLLDILSIS